MGKGVHSIDTGALAEERDPLQRQWDGQIIFYLEGIALFRSKMLTVKFQFTTFLTAIKKRPFLVLIHILL